MILHSPSSSPLLRRITAAASSHLQPSLRNYFQISSSKRSFQYPSYPLSSSTLIRDCLKKTPSVQRRFYASTKTMSNFKIDQYLADSPPTVVRLEIEKHFEPLSDSLKRYAHYISKAAFAGTRIVLRQASPESESIFDFIIGLYKTANGDWKALASKANVDEQGLQHFLEYAAQFLGNLGNYKSFGDSKFLPRCEESVFAALASTSPETEALYKATNGGIFSAEKQPLLHLGYPDDGHLTAYYPDSPDITKAEIDAVSDWMSKKGLLPENTRLRKNKNGVFEILIASANTTVPANGGDIGKVIEYAVEEGPLKGKTIHLTYGDYSQEMAKITEYIKKAGENASNPNQRDMHDAYAKSFETGSLLAFKDSQRFWIRDKQPDVETNIGFIESYRDPAGIRAEWEGFVAVVNKEQTKAFGTLVEVSPKLIPILPWPKEFEKDEFMSPDFSSLEVLTFNNSGIPAGINIPNYDDIRQNLGFKNVSLGNVLRSHAPNEKLPLLREEDADLYAKYRDAAFEVQVGLHELTGHGCGKLLQETAPGEFNFDKENPPVSPLTGKPVTSWYKPGQTWGSVFGSLAASYEECRAELVAMYLGCEPSVLEIFGFGDGSESLEGEAGDVLYISYLSMARAGLFSLEMWDPKTKKWGQAHSQARYSIFQAFLNAGEDFCKLEYTKDDLSDLTIHLDRSKITTVGRKAVGEYLSKLHIYKSTADPEGLEFYKKTTHVEPEFWGSKVRDVVLKNKQPRRVFVQANTSIDEASGKVEIKHYDATLENVIKSWVDRDL